MDELELVGRQKAADVIGCTNGTVTNLANRGVLTVVQRTRGGQRKYDLEQVRRVGVTWRAKYGTPSWWRESR